MYYFHVNNNNILRFNSPVLKGYLCFAFHLHETIRRYSEVTLTQLRNEMRIFALAHSDFEIILLDRIMRSTLSI